MATHDEHDEEGGPAALPFIELFAGGGSVHLAMREAGFTAVFANDLAAEKRESYAANFPGIRLDGRDIRDLRGRDLPDAVAVTSSHPCKDHTSKGLRRGYGGEHGVLAFEVIRLVHEMRAEGRAPKVVVIENVVGLLEAREDFAALAQALVSAGYVIGVVVIDALRFLPQSRERMFLVGVCSDVQIPEALLASGPTKAWHTPELRSAYDALPMAVHQSWRWFTLPRPPRRTTALADILEPGAGGWLQDARMERLAPMFTEAEHQRIAEARRAGITVGVVSGNWRDQRVMETRFDGTARCLIANEGGDSQQRIIALDDSGPGFRMRSLTPRERARLTGLPEGYVLPTPGKMARLAGDAVVVPVYAWLARHLIRPLADARLVEEIPAVITPAVPVRRARKPVDEDGRVLSDRPGIKGATVGQMNYLMLSTLKRLRAAARAEKVPSLTEFFLRLADGYFSSRSEPPCERYVSGPRPAKRRGKRVAQNGTMTSRHGHTRRAGDAGRRDAAVRPRPDQRVVGSRRPRPSCAGRPRLRRSRAPSLHQTGIQG